MYNKGDVLIFKEINNGIEVTYNTVYLGKSYKYPNGEIYYMLDVNEVKTIILKNSKLKIHLFNKPKKCGYQKS